MTTLIRLSEQDNVAVAMPTSPRAWRRGRGLTLLATQDPIPFAHKIAIQPIEAGAQVFKYGVPIGRAKVTIEAGQHVHVHNINSDYVNNEVDFFEEAAIDEPEPREAVTS